MSLRLRRGTNSQRLIITPAEGELIYTTDTKQVFVGDGQTLGGIDVSTATLGGTLGQDLNLGGHSITNGTNLTINGATGTISCASFNIGNTTFTNLQAASINSTAITNSANITTNALTSTTVTNIGTITSNSLNSTSITNSGTIATSSISVTNATTTNGLLYLNWNSGNTPGPAILPGSAGNLKNNIFDIGSSLAKFRNVYTTNVYANNVNGSFTGDIRGSVFTDSSTQVINGQTGAVSTSNIDFDTTITLKNRSTGSTSSIVVVDTLGNNSKIKIRYSSASIVTPGTMIGSLSFETNDPSGYSTQMNMISYTDKFRITQADNTGAFTQNNVFTMLDSGNSGFGTYTPNYKLDINGSFNAATVRSVGYVKIGLYTTTTRDALSPQNGMIIYNTTVGRLECYSINQWESLSNQNGHISIQGSILSTSDSSGIVINPLADFKSNVNMENDLTVMGNVYSSGFLSQDPGVGNITSDSSILINARNVVAITKSPFRLASFTTANRDLLISRNGDMIYNTDTNKFQGYVNGAWADLN